MLSFLKLSNRFSNFFTSSLNKASETLLLDDIDIKFSFIENNLFSNTSLSLNILFSNSDDFFIESFIAFLITLISEFKSTILSLKLSTFSLILSSKELNLSAKLLTSSFKSKSTLLMLSFNSDKCFSNPSNLEKSFFIELNESSKACLSKVN